MNENIALMDEGIAEAEAVKIFDGKLGRRA